MRWPWSRRKARDCEGSKAHKEAVNNLRDTEAKWPEVMEVAASLRDLRRRNHFAEQVTRIFQGGSK